MFHDRLVEIYQFLTQHGFGDLFDLTYAIEDSYDAFHLLVTTTVGDEAYVEAIEKTNEYRESHPSWFSLSWVAKENLES